MVSPALQEFCNIAHASHPLIAQSTDDDYSDHAVDASREDDGILLFTLLSPAALTTVQIVLLDAADMDTEVARIAFRASGTVTEGFHGVFVPDGKPFLGY